MSYIISIQRFDDTKAEYIDHPVPIHMEEWVSIIEADPELEFSGEISGDAKHPTGAIWIADPEHNVDGYQRFFWYNERRKSIFTKNVEGEEVIAKMREIAAKLIAHVIGEEGEEDWDWSGNDS